MAEKDEKPSDLGYRLAFILPGAFVGALVAGQHGATIGGLIGFALLLVYSIPEAIVHAIRKRRKDTADAAADAEANAAHDAETMSP